MSETPQRGGRFTTFFTSVPAGDVRVRGLPRGAAGSGQLGQTLLSTIAAVFAISPDTMRVLPPAPLSIGQAPPRRFMPRRPASETEPEYMTMGD